MQKNVGGNDKMGSCEGEVKCGRWNVRQKRPRKMESLPKDPLSHLHCREMRSLAQLGVTESGWKHHAPRFPCHTFLVEAWGWGNKPPTLQLLGFDQLWLGLLDLNWIAIEKRRLKFQFVSVGFINRSRLPIFQASILCVEFPTHLMDSVVLDFFNLAKVV